MVTIKVYGGCLEFDLENPSDDAIMAVVRRINTLLEDAGMEAEPQYVWDKLSITISEYEEDQEDE